jgi:hypothetical protein
MTIIVAGKWTFGETLSFLFCSEYKYIRDKKICLLKKGFCYEEVFEDIFWSDRCFFSDPVGYAFLVQRENNGSG